MAQKTRFSFAYKCKLCRDSFYRTHRRQRFCSIECKKKSRENARNNWRIKRKKQLSRDKDSKKTGVVKRVCRHCQKVFYTQAAQVKHRGGLYCSPQCAQRQRTYDSLSIVALDNLWRKASLKLKGNACEYCRDSQGLNVHHIFSRTNKKMRWDIDNGVILCVEHHTAGDFSAHKSPTEFVEWLKEKITPKKYDELRFKAKTVNGKINRQEKAKELFELIDNL